MGKLILKLIWFGFGVFGLIIIAQKYRINLPVLPTSPEEVKTLAPVIQEQAAGVLGAVTEQIMSYPARQVRKIKIGACEELLEEDICSVAREINCQ